MALRVGKGDAHEKRTSAHEDQSHKTTPYQRGYAQGQAYIATVATQAYEQGKIEGAKEWSEWYASLPNELKTLLLQHKRSVKEAQESEIAARALARAQAA